MVINLTGLYPFRIVNHFFRNVLISLVNVSLRYFCLSIISKSYSVEDFLSFWCAFALKSFLPHGLVEVTFIRPFSLLLPTFY